MSIRASFFSFIIRRTIKKPFANFDDPRQLREMKFKPSKLPDEITLEPVEVSGRQGEWVGWPGVDMEKVVLYFHGGGYVFGAFDQRREIGWRLAKESGARVLSAGYRLAPENTFPAAVEDATHWYQWLLEQGYAPGKIALAGDSAGGGLAVALLVNLKNLGLPLPKAAVLLSPWVDLAATGESVERNARADAMISPSALKKFADCYLGGHDREAPLASPLYADLSGLPPTLVIVGSTEVLLSDSERLVEKINAAGGSARLSVWRRMVHVFPVFPDQIPEAKQSITEIAKFLSEEMGTASVA